MTAEPAGAGVREAFGRGAVLGATAGAMVGEPFQTANLDWHIHPEVLPGIDLSLRDRDPTGFIEFLLEERMGGIPLR